ncbi:MAG: TonB-dependent receptor [Pseudomonadota bacterium]
MFTRLLNTARRFSVHSLSILLGAGLLAGAVPAANAQDDEVAELDEIIVTVERREQTLQEYAGTAQAFSGEDLLRDGVGSEFLNLANVVPGLIIANQEGNIEIFIRGVGSANNTEIGDPAVGTHINGVYIPRPRGVGVQFYDIERVEVNKGPQGTLRGRNSTGGTINIITRGAKLDETSGYLQAEFGNYNHQSFTGALNLPIGSTAAVRIAGFAENRDSNYSNVGFDQSLSPAGVEDEAAGRLSFSYRPNDRFSLEIVGDYTEEGGTGYPGVNIFQSASAGFGFEDIDPRDVVNRAVQGELDSNLWGVSIKAAYDFDRFSIEYLGSRRVLDFRQTNAAGNVPFYPGRDISPGGFNYENHSNVYWSQTSEADVHELRIAAPADARLRWSAGVFSLEEDQTVGFFAVTDNGVFFSGTEFTMPDVDVNSLAGYVDATYDLTERLRIKGGYRYTDEDKSRFGIGGNWTLGLGSDGFNCCFATRLGTAGFQPALTSRPNFIAPGNNAEAALFLQQGALSFGQDDTLVAQLAGVVDGSSPNGTCVSTDDTNQGGSQVCPPNGQHSFFTVAGPAQQVGSYSDNFQDFRFGFEFDLGSDSLLYATVSTGHKSGGFNDNLGEIAPSYEPEELTAYEIGSKNRFEFRGRTATFNAAAFFYDYEDQVFQSLIQQGGTGANGGFSLLNENVADTEILGAELFGSLGFGYGFSVDATLLVLDTEVKSGELADVRGQDFGQNPSAVNIDLTGNTLPNVSDWTFITRIQQEFNALNGNFVWQLLANYRSDYFLSIFNEDPIVRPDGSTICGSNNAVTCGFESEQEGFTTVNFGISYSPDDGPWRVDAYASNLFDEDASVKALLGNSNNLRFLNNPRQFGVRFSIDL